MNAVTTVSGAALLMLSVACSGEKACFDEPFNPDSVGSKPFQGSFDLAANAPPVTMAFDVNIDGMPELWPPSGAFNASLQATLLIQYADAADASPSSPRQMPRLSITIATQSGALPAMVTTQSFPTSDKSGLTIPVLSDCSELGSASSRCCPVGSRACADHVTFQVERVDNAPFPPVSIQWEVMASASANPCPFAWTPHFTMEPSATP